MHDEQRLGDLTLRTASENGSVIVCWMGKSNASAPEAGIVPVLLAAADRAREETLPLVFAFEDLEFFNSATITVLIRAIRALRGRAVSLTLRYDDGKRWQRTFFDAFAGVGIGDDDDVRLEALRR